MPTCIISNLQTGHYNIMKDLDRSQTPLGMVPSCTGCDWPLAHYETSLCFGFLVCEVELLIVPASWGHGEDSVIGVCEVVGTW